MPFVRLFCCCHFLALAAHCLISEHCTTHDCYFYKCWCIHFSIWLWLLICCFAGNFFVRWTFRHISDFLYTRIVDTYSCWLIGRCLSLLQMLLFLESIPSTPLNGSLQNFNTWRVSVGNRTLKRFFEYWTPKFCTKKLSIFDDFATQW